MMPTTKEVESEIKKVRGMVILEALIAFGAGFIAGGILI